ncbi:AAA ATPase-like domain-containing protein [Desulfonema limicola]|uniref:AAA ATPase-like domain-containing protein n=1 Tax=Desulfonema limicola TaxID=45656 RepID=A0A975GIL8_9BACT|nr:SUMF1/EgtB/PvdO family nonheme iron enzyme [Desulfonema limicola]QTA82740.1 AAA ATPase-like domain-containing protein [Desulfonema limicola]
MEKIIPYNNPFCVGTAIQNPSDFIGRRQELSDISSMMLNRQNISLRGERRTGKTSLLKYIVHPEGISLLGLQPDKHIPVFLNFQQYTESKPFMIWWGIAEGIAMEINKRLPEYKEKTDKYIQNIREYFEHGEFTFAKFHKELLIFENLIIHLLFDEFDQIVKNSELENSTFLDELRSLPSERKISYIIATRTGLASLQDDKYFNTKISSPFFNIFTTIILKPLDSDEAKLLIHNYLDSEITDIALAKEICSDIKYLYDITGHHPFFLQSFCFHLIVQLNIGDISYEDAKTKALQSFSGDMVENFKFYWDYSNVHEKELIKKIVSKQQIDSNDISAKPVIENLKNRCLLVPSSNKQYEWQLVSSVFGEWSKRYTLQNTLNEIGEDISYIEIVKYTINPEKPSISYMISKNPITIEILNRIPNMNLSGLSYFDAQKFASWFNARLPTEEEWRLAAKTGKISISQHKEWLLSDSKSYFKDLIFRGNIGNRRKIISMEQRPEENSPTYALRLIKDS